MYECDPNVGKYRKYRDCLDEDDGSQNAWQIEGMPLKASQCNGWRASDPAHYSFLHMMRQLARRPPLGPAPIRDLTADHRSVLPPH